MTTALRKKQIILLILFLITSVPFFVKVPSTNEVHSGHQELFDPDLASIRSVSDLVHYTDSIVRSENGDPSRDTILFVRKLTATTKKRFRHGLANYSITDNWIAYLSGKLFWSHFLSIVDADDIMKHNEGLCSQQSIVYLEALKEKGISARSVGLGKKEGPGHFITEVRYENDWHVYDVSSEPDWKKTTMHHKSMAYYDHNKDTLYKAYENIMPRDFFNRVMSEVNYGKVGEFPAKKMQFFHVSTYFITILLPFFFLLLFINSIVGKDKTKQII